MGKIVKADIVSISSKGNSFLNVNLSIPVQNKCLAFSPSQQKVYEVILVLKAPLINFLFL